jgi:hypothetical protein
MPYAEPERKVAMNRLVLVLVFVTAAAPARADIIHVPGQYPTIQRGIDAAVAGDIVMVAPGAYVEEIDLKAGVVVQGAGEGLSTIDGGGDAGDVVTAVGNAITPDTKLKGFTLTGALNGGGMPGGGGVFCNSGARPEITNCRITGNDCGVALWNGSVAYIANNIITDNLYDGVSTGSGATVVNNTIHNCRVGFYDYSGYGPVFMNNIVTGSSLYGIYGPSGGTPPALTYNDVWNNATNYQQATPGVGSDSVDPVYADSAGRDFHLQTGSPCIDAGNPAPQYNDPDGTRNDMGAYGGPGAVSDLPAITSLVPARNALAVTIPTSALAGFNVPMDPATFSGASFRMHSALTGWRFGPVTYDSVGHVAELDPDDELWPGELVMVELTTAVRSAGGDTFPGHLWQFFAAVGGGSGRFSDTVQTSTGANPTAVAAADFDGDNVLDVVVAKDAANQVSVYLGNGDGTFEAARDFAAGTGTRAVCCADFDSDSILDIAVANGTSDNMSILLGQGGGDFDPAVNYPCGDFPSDIATADVDLDGDMDVVVPLFDADSVAVLLNNGDGTFGAPVRFACGDGPTAVGVGDLDNDGRPDLVVTNGLANNFASLLNTGNGSFAIQGTYSAGSGTSAIKLGDFDEDGTLDAAVTGTTTSYVSVFTGDGAGGFSGRHDYTTGASARQVVAADLDADGHLDLAVANKDANTVSVLLGTGSGAFGAAVNWTPANDPLGLVYGDVDNDDDLDLVAASYTTSKLTALLNDNALRVAATIPAQYASAAPETTGATAVFNLGLNPATLDSTSFLVRGARTGLRHGAVGYDSAARSAWFNPAADFITGEPVTATLTNSLRGSNGTFLGGFSWTFTAAVPSASSGTFATQSAYPTGSEPRGLTVADFDADGDVDVVTTCNSPAAAALLRNNGDGTFATPAYTAVNGDPIAVFSADFDADGDVDLAVFHNEPGSSHLEILKNDGTGTFTNAGTYIPATLGQYVSGADFDGDGDVDIVVTDGWGSQDNVKVLTNNGSGTFTGPVSYSAGSWAHGVTTLDVDNDGDFDIACCNQGNDNISVLYNDGSGAFSRLANFGAGSGPEALYAHDLNGDGRVDIAIASTSVASAAVLLNDGAGGFHAPVSYALPSATHTIEGGDLDGDGDIDLGLASNNGTAAYVLLNNGDGTFGAAASYGTGSGTWTIGTADFNSDGALDLATTNYGANNISILLATGLGLSGSSFFTPRSSFSVYPNPFRNSLRITGKLQTADCKLRIYDAQGRLIRSFAQSSICNLESRMSVVWDGANSRGRRVAPGLYFVTLESGGSRTTAKVVLSR